MRDEELARHVRGAARGTLATVLTRVADVGATYGFYAILAHALSTADFGRFILGLTVLQIGAAVARLGLDQAVLAAAPGAAVNRLAMRRVAAAALGLSVLGISGWMIWPRPLPGFALVLIGGLPIVALAQIVISALRARGSVSLAATAESVSQPVSALLFAVFVVGVGGATLAHFAIAFVLSWVVPLLFAATLEWRGVPIERDAAARLLTAGTAMLGVYLLQQAANSADVLLLGVAATPAEVAHYAIAQKIAAAFLLLHGAVTNAAAPFVRRVAGDRRLLAAFRLMVTRWSVAAGMPLLVVTAGVPTLLLRLFGAEYAAASTLPLVLLSIGGVAYLLSGPAGTILLCTGHERVLFRVTAAGTVVLILCVAGLAPYGATGAAIGVLVGTLLTRGLLIGMLRRHVSLAFADLSLVTILGGAAAGILVARLSSPMLGEIGAAAVGILLAAGTGILVLRREGDLAFLRGELLPGDQPPRNGHSAA